jgi:N-acetylglucosaminyldiphosphoundecaprenol N-acetyl-beta-D-mannosaminyltransferase
MIKRYPVLNIWVDAVTEQEALQQVDSFIQTGTRLYTIFAVNPEKNYSVTTDPVLNEAFENADLLIPDGIGIVLAVKLLYSVQIKRLPGCEFMQNICDHSQNKGYKIFIYGAKEVVNEGAVKVLKERLPKLKIVGNCHGYWPDDKMVELVEKINSSGAQILFLALGSPKQEQWITQYRHQLKNIRVCQGIGGTLDVINGNVKRAPDIFCRLGLEWLYRLLEEPKRIKRQKVLPMFALQALIHKVKLIIKRKEPSS